MQTMLRSASSFAATQLASSRLRLLFPAATAAASRSACRPMTVLSKESGIEHRKENWSARKAATGRPVSPHVTVYSFPACALSSITTRVTGCMLSFGAAGLGLVELAGGGGAAAELMSCVGGGAAAGGFLVAAGTKFVVAFPLSYHFLGGLRHMVWDAKPEMLTNVDVERASYALVGASLLMGGAAAVV
ncbi:hypothetical protein ACHAWF_016578 [Thalassiosira exigua]